MVIFKYVEDKDVFQKFYSKMLAKRLVSQNSASDDAEATVISKLRVCKHCIFWCLKSSHPFLLKDLYEKTQFSTIRMSS